MTFTNDQLENKPIDTMDVEMEEPTKQPAMSPTAESSPPEEATMAPVLITAATSEGLIDGNYVSDGKEDPMDVDEEGHTASDSSKTGSATDSKDDSSLADSDEEDGPDVINGKDLCEKLSQIKATGDKLAGKDVLLLIGGTGAGKTTTTLHLLGATFEETMEGGEEHYVPSGLDQSILDEFQVSGSGDSVTKAIHATSVRLPNGKEITICDTPGFGDTEGIEDEIANGMGIINALQKARSVKPVLVFDQEGLSAGRFGLLRPTLQIVISMMGKQPDFSSFEYVFTRCDNKKSKNIHLRLKKFQDSRKGKSKSEEDKMLDALISDMINKTSPKAINIELDEEDAAAETLDRLLNSNEARLDNPETEFHIFLSREASDKLNLHVARILGRMEKALEAKGFPSFKSLLKQLVDLEETLTLPNIKRAVEEASDKLNLHVARILGRMEKALETKGFPSFKSLLKQLVDLEETLALPNIKRAVENGQLLGRNLASDFVARVGSLGERLLEMQESKDFNKVALELRELLLSFSELSSISDVCRVPKESSYSSVLANCAEKVITGIHEEVKKVQENPGEQWHSDLRKALVRLIFVARTLDGIVDNDMLSAMSAAPVASVSNLIKHQLGLVEENLAHPSSAALMESRASLEALCHMEKFLCKVSEKPGVDVVVSADKWAWFGERLGDMITQLVQQIGVSVDTLLKHTLDEDCGEAEDGWCQALSALGSDSSVVECRAFLLELFSSSKITNAVHAVMEDDQAEGDPSVVLAIFDGSLSKACASFAEFAHQWSSEKQPTSQKKKAEKLLTTAGAVSSVCEEHRASAPGVLDQVGKGLAGTKERLKMFIEQCKSVPQRPEDLPYGPKILGPPFYANLVQLQAYKKKHGDCNPTRCDKNPQIAKLGRWVDKQRTQGRYLEEGNKSSLTDERIEALRSLDFEWSVKAERAKAAWDLRFKDLLDFKEEHGHCNVPQKYKANKALGKWVAKQRERKSKCPKERICRLDSIGFEWTRR